MNLEILMLILSNNTALKNENLMATGSLNCYILIEIRKTQ
jgi:hypothetical protein